MIMLLELLLVIVGVSIAGIGIGYFLRRARAYPPALEATSGALLEGADSLSTASAVPEVQGEVLPAYVDPEDEASMSAWRQAKEEIETAW